MQIDTAGNVADAFAIDQAGSSQIIEGMKQYLCIGRGILNARQEQRKIGTVKAGGCGVGFSAASPFSVLPSRRSSSSAISRPALVDAGQIGQA